MANQTVKTYGNTFSGSIGAGMGSLFNPGGRRYYILEHKVSSKYHHQGETQEIIVDTIELGRDSRCQVRFDEHFSTVSRRHAAIIKDGTGWKLVSLSKTNTTFLNGQPVKNEWYLQNGDEIQLAVNGPKLGFIVPVGDKATVGSIGLTRRLSLFRQQAMRPYKTAIAALCALVLILASVGGYFLYQQNKELLNKSELIARLFNEAEERDSVYQLQLDSVAKIKNKVYYRNTSASSASGDVQKLVDEVKPYVYYVRTTFYINFSGQTHKISTSQGTGFLLDDGRFVTARHCVQPWLYSIDEYNALITTANVTGRSDITGYSIIEAQSMNNDYIKLRSSDFTINDTYDKIFETVIDESPAFIATAHPLSFKDGTQLGNEKMMSCDWAYARVDKKGGIKANTALSANLKAGTTVHVLGFPSGLGKGDGQKDIEPIYNRMSVSRDGLNNSGCIMVSEGVAHGNSGGPVFVVDKGHLTAIAVVSRKESATQQYGRFGITQQQQQYDHLVPLFNMR